MPGRNFIITFLISMSLGVALIGCRPLIHYLGDSLSPTTQVDLYYDAYEVKKEYRVMGRMTNDQFSAYNVQMIKNQMIRKAKKVGADGIIFSSLRLENNDLQGNALAVSAELIKYR